MFQSIHKLSSFALVAVASLGIGANVRAETVVAKSQREALVFIANLEQGDAAQRAFYDFVEFAAEAIAHTNLDPNYAGGVPLLPIHPGVTYVTGAAATRARLSNELDRITAKPGVKAVDLILVTHGQTGALLFSGSSTPVSMTTVRNDILAKLTAAQRAKLRMVFSTACFGSSHRTRWLQSGFKTVSGSQGIYADSAVSFLPAMVAWANGATFSQTIAAANAADVGNVVDLAAMAMYLAIGRPDLASLVNSTRLVSGASGLRISRMP